MGCANEHSCVKNSGSLADAIASEVSAAEGSAVVIAAVTNLNWDRMYVFPAYTSGEDVNAATGLSYPDGFRNHVPEGKDLVVFAFSDRPVCHAEVWDGRCPVRC